MRIHAKYKRFSQILRRPSNAFAFLNLVLAAIAIFAGVSTFLYASAKNDRQNTETQLVQLRSQYARISTLENEINEPSPPGLAGIELDVQLAVASSSLRELGSKAAGADYEFVADAYRQATHPEAAVPLYEEALRRTSIPSDRIVILRGLGYARVLLGDLTGAREALREAIAEDAATSYPAQVKLKNDANTERVWVTVEVTAGQCQQARAHLRRYVQLANRLQGAFSEGTQRLSDLRKQIGQSCK